MVDSTAQTATAQTSEFQRRVQAIEGIERDLTKAPNSPEQAQAVQKMLQEVAAENASKDLSVSAQVVKQLRSDNYTNVSIDDQGNMIFNPSDKTANSASVDQTANSTSLDQSAQSDKSAPSSVRKPQELDFVKFAEMLSKVQSGQTVEAKDFPSVFGAEDAAILQSMGLQSVSDSSGHFKAGFAQSGSIPFGSDLVQFSKSVEFDLKTTSSGVEMDNIKGLKGKEDSLNPTVTKVKVGPDDPSTNDYTVVATGKELFVSADKTYLVSDVPTA